MNIILKHSFVDYLGQCYSKSEKKAYNVGDIFPQELQCGIVECGEDLRLYYSS